MKQEQFIDGICRQLPRGRAHLHTTGAACFSLPPAATRVAQGLAGVRTHRAGGTEPWPWLPDSHGPSHSGRGQEG